MFTHDVDGKPRNNKHLLPKRNWCSITEYTPGLTPPPTPPSLSPTPSQTSLSGKSPGILQRTLSLGRGDSSPGNQLIRRLSLSNRKPVSFADDITSPYQQQNYPGPTTARYDTPPIATRPVSNFHRRPTNLSEKAAAKGAANNHHVDLEYGLDISLNCEIKQGDPSGSTEQYRLLVPALFYDGPLPEHKKRKEGLVKRFASRRKSGAPSSYPSTDNGGSRTNSRDSWAAGDRNSFDTDSVSVYDDSKIPATTSTTPQGGLFRRLSNRIQRSTSQTRGLPTNGNISQNYQQQPPEPFKPRPQPSQQRPQQQEDEEDEEDDEEAQSQIYHQQQKQRLLQKQNPLQGALRRPGPSSSSTAAAARNPSGAYTVDNKSPRSPPTSFAQKPYFPPSPPPPVLQSSYLAQPTPKSTQSTPTATATAFNRTPPIPRRGPVNANPTATKTTATTTPVTATSRTTRNNHDPNKRNGRAYSFTSDQDHDRNNASQTDSESDYEPRNHHHHPAAAATAAAARTTRGARAGGMTNVASGPSGRGNGAAKFFGADYDDLQNGNVSGNGNRIKKGGVAGGGYGGIEAYTSSSQSHSNAQRSGGRQGSYGYENGYENEDGNGGREKRGWRKFLSI